VSLRHACVLAAVILAPAASLPAPFAAQAQEALLPVDSVPAEPSLIVAVELIDYEIALTHHGALPGLTRFAVATIGNTRHTFRVEGPGTDIKTRMLFIAESSELDVFFSEPGVYTLYCDVGFHAGAGMITPFTVFQASELIDGAASVEPSEAQVE